MSENWLEIQTVRTHADAACEFIAREHTETLRMCFDLNIGRRGLAAVESPLEAIFFLWYIAFVSLPEYEDLPFALDPQQETSVDNMKFRLDFAVVPSNEWAMHVREGTCRQFPLAAVEVDGHGFHEKTREQVAYRNERDRLLQKAGWTVLHYSWSEITERPVQCLEGLIQQIKALYLPVQMEYWNRTVDREQVDRVIANIKKRADGENPQSQA